MIKVGDVYKDGSGRYFVVYDITREIIWYYEASKYGIRCSSCLDTYVNKLLTKVEV